MKNCDKLFLTTKQTIKLGNAFANNLSTDIKLSRQILNLVKPKYLKYFSQVDLLVVE